MNKELAQLKLIDGHEVVCEVIEWPDKGENQIIVRNAMSIVTMESHDGEVAYVFRPFVHFLEDEHDYILLRNDHVMCINRPKGYLSEQYEMSVSSMLQTNRDRVEEYEEAKKEGQKLFEEKMHSFLESYEYGGDYDDSDKSNVIPFPPKDTLH